MTDHGKTKKIERLSGQNLRSVSSTRSTSGARHAAKRCYYVKVANGVDTSNQQTSKDTSREAANWWTLHAKQRIEQTMGIVAAMSQN